MSFIFFLLTLWLAFVLLRPLLRRWFARQMQKRVNNAFRNAFGGPASAPPRPPRERRAGWSREGVKPRKKKIDSSVGEYVCYEDVEVTASTTDTRGNTTTDYVREQQITDVEWEDLPPAK